MFFFCSILAYRVANDWLSGAGAKRWVGLYLAPGAVCSNTSHLRAFLHHETSPGTDHLYADFIFIHALFRPWGQTIMIGCCAV